MACSLPVESGWWMPAKIRSRWRVNLTSPTTPPIRSLLQQSLIHTLGLGSEVWRILDKCHGIRNSVEYEGAFEVNQQLVADLLKATDAVRVAVEKLGRVPTANPNRKTI
jgi:hypothetical protein